MTVPGLKPYPAYKPSGVEWLGDVPAHWEVRRLGQIGSFSRGRGGSKDDERSVGVSCVRYGDLYTTHQYAIEESRSFVSPDRAAEYTQIKFGDLLFAASGESIDEIGKSAVNLIASDARCGGDIILFRPRRKVEVRYLGYASDSHPAMAYKATMGRGFTVVHIYTSELKYLSLALPPLLEQAAIARYLEHADRRIRRYVAAKERLVKLLEEYRQTLIRDAVTGQVDVRTGQPYPAYKPSGVEWLGDVPAHWGVHPNRATFSERNDRDHAQEQLLSVTIADGVVRQQELLEDTSKNSQKDRSRLDKTDYKLVEPGDVAYNKMRAWQGAIGVSNLRGIVSPAYVVQRPRSNAHSAYLHYLLRTPMFAKEAERSSYGIASDMWCLRAKHFKMIYGCIPPIPEQVAIARYLEHADRRLQTCIQSSQQQIELLKEFRTRLIADVVTGKLDVRDQAESLPRVDSIAGNNVGDVPGDFGVTGPEPRQGD